jgi:hypothetical protein
MFVVPQAMPVGTASPALLMVATSATLEIQVTWSVMFAVFGGWM